MSHSISLLRISWGAALSLLVLGWAAAGDVQAQSGKQRQVRRFPGNFSARSTGMPSWARPRRMEEKKPAKKSYYFDTSRGGAQTSGMGQPATVPIPRTFGSNSPASSGMADSSYSRPGSDFYAEPPRGRLSDSYGQYVPPATTRTEAWVEPAAQGSYQFVDGPADPVETIRYDGSRRRSRSRSAAPPREDF